MGAMSRSMRMRWLGWLAAGAIAPVSADVPDATRSGFTIENARNVPVPPERAWQALVEEVDRWWPRDRTWWGAASVLSIDPVPGGCFCEAGPNGHGAAHLQVVFVDPRSTLRLVGGLGPLQGMGLHGVLEWRLAPQGDGTRITMYYRAGRYAPDDLSRLAPVVDRVMA
jgi:uncharacterized protein YndB with AHSA1/START domain